jgi:hypothetical protein
MELENVYFDMPNNQSESWIWKVPQGTKIQTHHIEQIALEAIEQFENDDDATPAENFIRQELTKLGATEIEMEYVAIRW